MVYDKKVKRPAVVEQYFDGANAIDIHNHLRQGGLELERHWQTQTWWHRNFATIIGICETVLSSHFNAFIQIRLLLPTCHIESLSNGYHCSYLRSKYPSI